MEVRQESLVTPLIEGRRRRQGDIALGGAIAMAALCATPQLCMIADHHMSKPHVPYPPDTDLVFWTLAIVFAFLYPLARLSSDGSFWTVIGKGRVAEELMATCLTPADLLRGYTQHIVRSSFKTLGIAWGAVAVLWLGMIANGMMFRPATAGLVLLWPLLPFVLMVLLMPSISFWLLTRASEQRDRGYYHSVLLWGGWVFGMITALALESLAAFAAIGLLVPPLMALLDRSSMLKLLNRLSRGEKPHKARVTNADELKDLRVPSSNPIVVRAWTQRARTHGKFAFLKQYVWLGVFLSLMAIVATGSPEAAAGLACMLFIVQPSRVAVSTARAVRRERESETLEPLASTCMSPSDIADGFVFVNVFNCCIESTLAAMVLAVPAALAGIEAGLALAIGWLLLMVATVTAGYVGFLVGVTARSMQEAGIGSLVTLGMFGYFAMICAALLTDVSTALFGIVGIPFTIYAARWIGMNYLRRAIAEPLKQMTGKKKPGKKKKKKVA